MKHYDDGAFRYTIGDNVKYGPCIDTFVVSHNVSNFAFTIGRQFYCFNGSERNELTRRFGLRKMITNNYIYLMHLGKKYILKEDCFNFIDCHEYELLLFSFSLISF